MSDKSCPNKGLFLCPKIYSAVLLLEFLGIAHGFLSNGKCTAVFLYYMLKNPKNMTTQVNGVEITPQITEVLTRWYGNAISREDSRPFYYVKELSILQDFLCRMVYEVDEYSEFRQMISTVTNLKDDFQELAV